MIIQALLGLEFNPAAAEIRLNNPMVPDFIGQITVRGLRLGGSTIDFVVGSDRDALSLRTLRQDGPIRITVVSHNRAE